MIHEKKAIKSTIEAVNTNFDGSSYQYSAINPGAQPQFSKTYSILVCVGGGKVLFYPEMNLFIILALYLFHRPKGIFIRIVEEDMFPLLKKFISNVLTCH